MNSLRAIFVLLYLSISPLISAETILLSEATETLPVLYEGRFVPLHRELQQLGSSLLWSETSADFAKQPSLDSLLWRAYLFGDEALHVQPLFQLPLSLSRRLQLERHIPLHSYESIQAKLQQPECEALCWLIYALYLEEALKQPADKEGSPIELSTLAPGLWVGVRQSDVVILALPSTSNWKEWKKGFVLGAYVGKDQMKRQLEAFRPDLDSFLGLLQALRMFENFAGATEVHRTYKRAVRQLKEQGLSPKEIVEQLEKELPLQKRLEKLGNYFQLIATPNKGQWLPLHVLLFDTYNPATEKLEPLANLSAYPDALFQQLQTSYRTWLQNLDPHHPAVISEETQWPKLLWEGYQNLAGKAYLETARGALYYPPVIQFQLESLYTHWPVWEAVLLFYLLAAGSAWLGQERAAKIAFLLAFCFHTVLLIIRCYLLERPPVSNMSESLLFVPWAASLIGIAWWFWSKSHSGLYAAATLALPLLGFAIYSGGAYRLDHVQPVLNSQYWLTVHVLMVVSSYGAYLLGGVAAQWALWQMYKNRPCSSAIEQLVLGSLYLGTALLIAGTLLGGVWAAQSWGRFWDWDPKESWAFITSVLYLVWIHAYRFQLISTLGLFVGAVVGLQAVTFTWYGVNYILGTGLHSYGFGSGGEGYYFLFVIVDLVLITFWASRIHQSEAKKRLSATGEKTA